jgi:ribose 5-phosphate isomerase A
MLSIEEIKKKAAVYAADFVKQGAAIGLGTGSTVYWLIQELGERTKKGLNITVVPTSIQTEQLAKQAGITVSNLDKIDRLLLTIDGADEIDPKGQLIKGGGGALLQEKIVASASAELIIIVDNTKLVNQLGKFPLPVEVISFGYKQVREKILQSGYCKEIKLREKESNVFITDHQHYILDCYCEKINDAFLLNENLHLIPGVVETGLFINMTTKAIIAYANGKIEEINFQD